MASTYSSDDTVIVDTSSIVPAATSSSGSFDWTTLALFGLGAVAVVWLMNEGK